MVDLPKHDYLFSRQWSASRRLMMHTFRQRAQLCKLQRVRAVQSSAQTSKQQ